MAAKLTEADERVIRTCGISGAAFLAEREREEAEKAAATGERPDVDGLTGTDLRLIRRFGIDRATFIQTRRLFGTA